MKLWISYEDTEEDLDVPRPSATTLASLYAGVHDTFVNILPAGKTIPHYPASHVIYVFFFADKLTWMPRKEPQTIPYKMRRTYTLGTKASNIQFSWNGKPLKGHLDVGSLLKQGSANTPTTT